MAASEAAREIDKQDFNFQAKRESNVVPNKGSIAENYVLHRLVQTTVDQNSFAGDIDTDYDGIDKENYKPDDAENELSAEELVTSKDDTVIEGKNNTVLGSKKGSRHKRTKGILSDYHIWEEQIIHLLLKEVKDILNRDAYAKTPKLWQIPKWQDIERIEMIAKEPAHFRISWTKSTNESECKTMFCSTLKMPVRTISKWISEATRGPEVTEFTNNTKTLLQTLTPLRKPAEPRNLRNDEKRLAI
ncbi:hypothetical protein ILUMI_16228 [Ignelater luminosus]|uniref:Uncharacterized protein n=1 Tax=Ignelater luminosus TaxID=2038154 RepID=A0A8K0CUU6_IGNLU|nr:hypothetical protein ILUMI_16228 [Ignelater luminosus]